MKTSALFLALMSVGLLSAAEVERGDSIHEVRQTLGQPRGQVHVGERHLLYYERGEVELRDGRVTRVAMLSPEEYTARVARDLRQSEQREARRQDLLERGEALRDRKLADPLFAKAPLAYQVAFWEDFARRYPGVSVSEPLAIARLNLQEKLEAQRKQEEADARLAELELRLAEAERLAQYRTLWSYGYRDRHYRPFTLAPFEYTFFDRSLAPYSTPSGNPAGELHGPLITTPTTNPAGELHGPLVTWPMGRLEVRAVDERRDRRGEDRRWERDDRPRGRWEVL